MAGMGSFGGGFAKGYQSAHRMKLENEREKREQEEQEYRRAERAREEEGRRVAGRTLGLAGQEAVTGFTGEGMTGGLDDQGWTPQRGTLGFDQAMDNYSTQIAGLFPERAVNTQVQRRQLSAADEQLTAARNRNKLFPIEQETANLGLRNAQRADERAGTENQILALQRALMANPGSYMEVFRKLQEVNKAIPNGYDAKVFDFNGQPHALVFNEAAGEGQPVPLNHQTVGKILQGMYDFTSPQAAQQRREYGLNERRTRAAEDTAGAAARNAVTTENYRRDQQPVLESQAREHNARARLADRTDPNLRSAPGAATSEYDLEQRRLFDAQKQKLIDELEAGKIDDKTFQRRLNTLSLRYGGQMRSERTGMQPVQGNPGMYSDGQRLYRMDDRSQALIEVPTPQSLDQLGQNIVQTLTGRGGVPQPGAPGVPQQVQPSDMGYDPNNQTQYAHVLSNLQSPKFRAQAMFWMQSGALTRQQRAELQAKLGVGLRR